MADSPGDRRIIHDLPDGPPVWRDLDELLKAAKAEIRCLTDVYIQLPLHSRPSHNQNEAEVIHDGWFMWEMPPYVERLHWTAGELARLTAQPRRPLVFNRIRSL